jgi:acyl carrier protein
MLERIQEVFVRITGMTDFVITPKTRLDKKSVNISSFTMVQLFCEIEDEFGVDIPNLAIKKMKTVKDLMDYLSKNT